MTYCQYLAKAAFLITLIAAFPPTSVFLIPSIRPSPLFPISHSNTAAILQNPEASAHALRMNPLRLGSFRLFSLFQRQLIFFYFFFFIPTKHTLPLSFSPIFQQAGFLFHSVHYCHAVLLQAWSASCTINKSLISWVAATLYPQVWLQEAEGGEQREGRRERGKRSEGSEQIEDGTAVGSRGSGQTKSRSQRLPPLWLGVAAST